MRMWDLTSGQIILSESLQTLSFGNEGCHAMYQELDCCDDNHGERLFCMPSLGTYGYLGPASTREDTSSK
jgi:hypothetical protein